MSPRFSIYEDDDDEEDDDDDDNDNDNDEDEDDDEDENEDDDDGDAPRTCTRVVAMLGRVTSSSKSVKRLTVLLAKLGIPRNAITNG